MNDRQNSYLGMLDFVSKTLDRHAPIWSGNSICAAYKAELDAAIAGMRQSIAAQMTKVSSEGKKAARNALEAAVSHIAKALCAYSVVANDEDLRADARVSDWALRKATTLALLGTAKGIADLATTHLSALDPFDITAAIIADAASKSTAFSALIGTPAAAVKRRRESTRAIESFRKSGVAACQNLDLIVPIFGGASPEFVAAFKAARRIPKPGHRKRALQVRITNTAGQPVAAALISIPPLKVKRKTTAKGQAYIQHLRPGNHTLHIAAAGFVPQEVPISISANQRTVVEEVLS